MDGPYGRVRSANPYSAHPTFLNILFSSNFSSFPLQTRTGPQLHDECKKSHATQRHSTRSIVQITMPWRLSAAKLEHPTKKASRQRLLSSLASGGYCVHQVGMSLETANHILRRQHVLEQLVKACPQTLRCVSRDGSLSSLCSRPSPPFAVKISRGRTLSRKG